MQQVIAAEKIPAGRGNPIRLGTAGGAPRQWMSAVFCLPASSTGKCWHDYNARALEHAIRKMLSHPVMEVRAMGEEIKAAALESTPHAG